MNRFQKHRATRTSPGRIKELYQSELDQLEIKSVLDWGCSYGDSTNDLKEIFPEDVKIFGLDEVVEAITSASKKFPDINFIHEDGYEHYKTSKKYDLVLCNNNIFYLFLKENFTDGIIKTITLLVNEGGWLGIGANYGINARAFVLFKKEEEKFKVKQIVNEWVYNPRFHDNTEALYNIIWDVKNL